MSETSKKIAIIMVLLFATSLIMGVAFARVSMDSEYDLVKKTAVDYSEDIARLQAEVQFYRDVSAALREQDEQTATYYEELSDQSEEELYATIRDLEKKIDKLKKKRGRSSVIFTPGSY